MNTQQRVIAFGALAFAAFWLMKPKALTPSVTTSETIDLDPLGGLGMTDYGRKIKDFGNAIARAEGFFVQGSIPARACNPGNLKTPSWTAPGEIEGATLGEGIACFQSVDAGWNALYRQLYLIVNGGSNVYSLDDTIATMAVKWTGNATEGSAWGNNVARTLGVDINTPLYEALV